MDFERFDELACTDRIALLTALELLWQNGRSMIQTEDVPSLMTRYVADIGNFYTEKKLCKVVTFCKELASLDTPKLILYLRCSGMEMGMKIPGADEEGICPICGGDLEYGDDEPLDDGGVYEWTCLHCGATGKEGYSKVFDRHYDVQDKNGDPYPDPSDSTQNTSRSSTTVQGGQ